MALTVLNKIGTASILDNAITSGKIVVGAAGKVLQVVQGTFSTQTDSSINGAVATGLTVNITPGYSNSKILVSYSLPLRNGVSNNR